MQNEGSLCKIIGDEKIEKMKERLWRIQLNIGSLEEAQKTLQRILTEFQKPKEQRDQMLLESMTCYAVVLYTKCFNSELSDKLDSNIFSDSLPDSASSADLSEREFHGMIMNYRNMHLVHSDKLLKVADTGGMKKSDGSFGIGVIVASRAFQEEMPFYQGLNSLVTKSLAETKKRIEATRTKLIAAINNGQAKISSDIIQLMPVSDQISPREMWGLPARR